MRVSFGGSELTLNPASHAFRAATGASPSAFRERPDWRRLDEAYEAINAIERGHMDQRHIETIEFPSTRIAAIEHRGDPRSIFATVRKFVDWRKRNGLSPSRSATYNVFYDDPRTTPPDAFRMDIAAAIEGAVEPNEHGVVEKTIPAGRCAVLRYVGGEDGLSRAIHHLYASWLPASGEDLRDFPLFLQRVRFFPEVPDHEAVTDIFLPLR